MNTTDRVRVRIDLARVANNLRTPDGQSAGEGSAKAFLHHVGFQPDGDGAWLCPRENLRRLNPGEVVGVEAIAW